MRFLPWVVVVGRVSGRASSLTRNVDLGGLCRHRRVTLDVSAFPDADDIDPFELASDDLRGMTSRIKDMLGVDHPVLSTVAKYGRVCHRGCHARLVVWACPHPAVSAAGTSLRSTVARKSARPWCH